MEGKTKKNPSEASAYRALPLLLPGGGGEKRRYLWIRAHRAEPGGDERLAERTLFVATVPAG